MRLRLLTKMFIHINSFGGEVLSVETLKDRSTWGKLDIKGFISYNTKTIREPKIM